MLTEATSYLTVDDAPDLPLLAGKLVIGHHRGTRSGRPYLMILTPCPWCRAEAHAHRWAETPGPYDPDQVIRRRAHCRAASRFAGRDYLIRPNPLDADQNERIIEECLRQLARWQANRRMREQFAERRAGELAAAKARASWSPWTTFDEPGMRIGTRNGPPRDRLAGGLGPAPR